MYLKGSGSNSRFNFFATFNGLVFLLCVLFASVADLLAQDFKQVHPGVEYAQVDHMIGVDQVKINLLRLDLTKVGLEVRHAFDRAIGLETTSSIATRRNAVAAINGGFFRLDESEFAGDAAGLLVIDGKFVSDSTKARIALVFGSHKKGSIILDFDHYEVRPGIYPSTFGGPRLAGINRERKPGEAILFSPEFGKSTMTKSAGTEVVLSDCRKSFCRRIEVLENSNNTQIPRKGFVISIDVDHSENETFATKLKALVRGPRKYRFVQVEPFTIPPEWGPLIGTAGFYMIAGVPQLIRGGKIDITWEQEKASRAFVFNRHPRTAVAKLKDGKFLMLTVDGRRPGVSVGMNLPELAEYLLSLGAVDAMNLDGGGSTTMFLDGKVVNQPSDPNGERKVGDALIVTLRNK